MSKKIKIINSDINRPNLLSLFKSYICNRKVTKGNKKLRDLGDGVLIEMDDEEYEDMMNYFSTFFPDLYPREEDDYPDDPYASFWEREEVKESRRTRSSSRNRCKNGKKRGKGKVKTKIIDMRSYNDDEYNFDDITLGGNKVIWFYPDYHVKTDRIQFKNIRSFDKYCCENGYNVPLGVQDDIVYRTESHCCLNPKSERKGELEIVAEHSYGEMFYEVCDPEELGYE